MSAAEPLMRAVKKFVAPGGREPGSAGHANARRFLLERIQSLGLEEYPGGSYESPYEQAGISLVNVMGRLPGQNDALPPVLVAAHYDTFGPFPGADDNAAAMAILLSLIEPLQKRQLDRSVVFAFFDAEEPPFFLSPAMGSIQFYKRQRREEIHCAIVLDLCGHDLPIPGLEDLLFVTGMESDPELTEVLRGCERQSGIGIVATLNRYIGDLSDHHVFRLNERPYLFLSCGRWPHYHRPTDTPDKLNYQKMARIANYVESLVCATSERELAGPFEDNDPVEAELYLLRKAIGPFLETRCLTPKSRGDTDRIVKFFITQFGLLG